MHEYRISLIKTRLEKKSSKELRKILKNQDQDMHSADTLEAVKRILMDRGEKIEDMTIE